MSLNTKFIEGVSKSGLTGDDLASIMDKDLEATKENNRSIETIDASDKQERREIRYHRLCIIAFVGVFIICFALLSLAFILPDWDSKIVIPAITTLVGSVLGFVVGKKI